MARPLAKRSPHSEHAPQNRPWYTYRREPFTASGTLGMDEENAIDLTCPETLARVQRIARHLASTKFHWWTRRDKDDFVKEAPGLIELQKSRYRGPRIGPWVWSVLRNAGVGCGRREQVRRDLLRKVAIHQSESRSAVASVLDRERMQMTTRPFSAADVAVIESWTIEKRLTLLVLAGLWEKVTFEKWKSWCQEVGMKMEYPPLIWRAMTPAALRSSIAAAMGIERGTLDTRISRWELKHSLLQLEYCRGWLDSDGGAS